MGKKYVVINFFTDLRDYDHPYNAGDEFPRQGVNVGEERLAELSGNGNRQGRPLIRLVDNTNNQNPPAQKEEVVQPEAPEQQPETPEQAAVPDTAGETHKYTKEEIEDLKLAEIRIIASKLGFKISSTSKDGAVAEFLEKQG